MISKKTAAARITKLDTCSTMSPGNPFILGVKRTKVKVTSDKYSASMNGSFF